VLGIVTLGLGFVLSFLTRWVVNAIILKITDAFTTRLKVATFGTALFAAAVISLVGAIGQWIFGI
jgi:putative membrane protein